MQGCVEGTIFGTINLTHWNPAAFGLHPALYLNVRNTILRKEPNRCSAASFKTDPGSDSESIRYGTEHHLTPWPWPYEWGTSLKRTQENMTDFIDSSYEIPSGARGFRGASGKKTERVPGKRESAHETHGSAPEGWVLFQYQKEWR